MAWRESPRELSKGLKCRYSVSVLRLTELVDVFLVLSHFFCVWDHVYIFVLADRGPAFCEDRNFMPGQIVVLDGLADDLLRSAVGVVVRGVPLIRVNNTLKSAEQNILQ